MHAGSNLCEWPSIRRLARKTKLMFLHRHSMQSLAAAAGLVPARVRAAESGVGALLLDDLEKSAGVAGGC